MFHFSKSFDWRKSKAHLLLLSKFINGGGVDYFVKRGEWVEVLGEPSQKAIRRFIDEGMVVDADLNTCVTYKCKATELKDLLRQRKLNVSGTKDELVQRLAQADKEGMLKLTAGMKLLTCTEAGRELAEQYAASAREERIRVEQQVLGLLARRMYEEACLTVAHYESGQVFPRGLGVDWKHYDPKRQIEILNSIFDDKPEILSKLQDAKLGHLRIGAAMMELWGESRASKWLPADFETGIALGNDSAARMLVFAAQNKQTLRQLSESGFVKYVEILATPDSCESCKKLEGKQYRLGETPTLPNPNCTHELGCRCVYLSRTN